MSRTRKELSAAQLAAVSRMFAALSEPSRLLLLHALRGGPLTVNELVRVTGLRQANASKQLALLFDARLVKRQREGTSVRYAISDPVVFSLCELVCGKMAKDARSEVALFHPDI
jgi:DNA-binding transcriptional ArsR family regulator